MRRAVEPNPLTLSHVVLVALLGLSTLAVKKGLYRVEDGHVGVCYFGGRLQNTLQAPGYSMHLPLLTSCLSVPVQMQTRRVTHIACGTSGGTVVEFESIEVVYRLRRAAVVDTIRNYSTTFPRVWIDERVHSEVNQLCSQNELRDILIDRFDEVDDILLSEMKQTLAIWAPGIDLVTLRLTKPVVPPSIQAQYERLEQEKVALRLATAVQGTTVKAAENARRTAVKRAEKDASLSAIAMASNVAAKASEVTISAVEDATALAAARGRADAAAYAAATLARSEALLLTPALLAHERAVASGRNLKVYYGSSLPKQIVRDGRSGVLPSPYE